MKILGYIVTDRRIKGVEDFVCQVDDVSLADTTKPILFVGWRKIKNDVRYKNILDNKLDENVFWTFSPSEDKSKFEENLLSFYEYIINNILYNIKYYYINIFKLKYNNIKKIYNIISSIEDKSIYISKDMVYIPYNGNVLGVSLQVLEFCRIAKGKVVEKIKSMANVTLVDDSSALVKKFSRYVKGDRYVIPYLL